MRKNGFTLIELLAVIVILAIIALIATPIILGIINDAREESNERSVELYASAVKNGIAAHQLTKGEVKAGTYTEETLSFEIEDVVDGKVECTTIEIYEDGNVYVEGCTVNGGTKTYSYGTKQEKSNTEPICTRQNDEVGYDTVTCTIGENTESFYVMNSYLTDVPSDKIVMMTKYNIDPTTYRQSENAGTVAFTSTRYWTDTPNAYSGNLLSKYGNGYPADVYDDNNVIIKPVVDNYVRYLNGSLIEDATGSLLTYSQAEDLGCDSSFANCGPNSINGSPVLANPAPSWVYSTSYWLGSALNSYAIWNVSSNGFFSGIDDNPGNDDRFGARPVITISTREIQQ